MLRQAINSNTKQRKIQFNNSDLAQRRRRKDRDDTSSIEWDFSEDEDLSDSEEHRSIKPVLKNGFKNAENTILKNGVYKPSRNDRLVLKTSLARGSLDTLHPGKSISVPSTPPGLGLKNEKGSLYRSISFADRDIVVEVPSRSQLNFDPVEKRIYSDHELPKSLRSPEEFYGISRSPEIANSEESSEEENIESALLVKKLSKPFPRRANRKQGVCIKTYLPIQHALRFPAAINVDSTDGNHDGPIIPNFFNRRRSSSLPEINIPEKVENCDAGKKNIPTPAHLKSLHNPEDKGYLDESPGSSIRAAGSDSDFDSDRENEKFTSLKRTYSRSSIASHITDFRDKIKVSLTGDLKKVQADNNTKLKLAVLFFFSICLGIVVTSHVLYNQQVGEVQIFPEIKLLEAERRILMKISDYDVASDLGVNIPYNLDPYDCLPGVHHNETVDEKCAEWKDKARLIIKRIESEESLSCYKFFWQALTSSISPMDCWSPNLQGNWYGGGERLHMSWPLERSSVKLSPFVTGDEDQTEWGNVIKRYFINSLGVSLRISDETPLSVSLDPVSGLCLKAHYDEFPYYYHKKGYPQLNYTVCTHESLMHLYSSQLTSSFWDGHKESDLQELRRLLKLPLWQLPPARNGQPLDMNYVSTYIKGILGRSASITRGESRGYLLIDSSWQQNMGDLLLSDRLRDLERTVSNSGLTLVLTLTPFVSTDSTSFNEGLEKGLFVMERKLNITRDIPALTWYKNVPAAALLDITNNQTVSWIKSRLRDVVSVMPSVVFFVETGNAFHTPHYFQFEEALYNPDLYKDLFISVAMTEIKVIGVSGASSKRPKAPAFVHLTPLASNWDSLRTIIPNVLNLGVIGYPFVSTGPVGGDVLNNATNQTTRTSSNEIVPESELFIRWWQLATFMPQIHFTTPPTQYRNKYMPKVAENLKFIKEEVVNPELIRFSQIAMENSAPVIRPLWMLHSDDSVAQTINDEFLIGDKILVAPVLDQGKVKRNVYLPRSNSGSGVWKRGTDGTFFEGGQWLNDSLAPLETVLYFIRQPDFARPDSNLS